VPLYEYQCPHCGRFELIRKFSDPLLTICPTCGREVTKLLSAPAIQFKGTGWYITDYARKSGGGDSGSKGESKAESKAETKAASGEGASKTESGSSSTAATASKDSGTSGAKKS
jgi:putative FmdB family regulatory protein